MTLANFFLKFVYFKKNMYLCTRFVSNEKGIKHYNPKWMYESIASCLLCSVFFGDSRMVNGTPN